MSLAVCALVLSVILVNRIIYLLCWRNCISRPSLCKLTFIIMLYDNTEFFLCFIFNYEQWATSLPNCWVLKSRCHRSCTNCFNYVLYLSFVKRYWLQIRFTNELIHVWCSVRLYLQLYVGGPMSCSDYLLTHSCVQHTLCFCFACLSLVYLMLPVSLDCPYFIAPSVFSNVYVCGSSVNSN